MAFTRHNQFADHTFMDQNFGIGYMTEFKHLHAKFTRELKTSFFFFMFLSKVSNLVVDSEVTVVHKRKMITLS